MLTSFSPFYIISYQFKALVITLAARLKVSPALLPNNDELDIIFEALDEDASGSISLDEWNAWILDGLSSSGTERATMSSQSDLNKKMNFMLVCLEQLANEAGKKINDLNKSDESINTSNTEDIVPGECNKTLFR